MNKSNIICRNQFAMFKREKGMIAFYCFFIIISGIVVPFFLCITGSYSILSPLLLAHSFVIMLVKPMLADSLAGERENKTLETLLSAPFDGKTVIWGKFKFCMSFATCFFGLSVLCAVLTSRLAGYKPGLSAWQWSGVILSAILCFCAVSIAGVYASAKAENLRAANSRVSRAAYPLGLLFIVCLSVIVSADFYSALVVGIALISVCLCVVFVFAYKTATMKQSDYYENIKIKKSEKPHDRRVSYNAPKSQFGIVLLHELKYLLTLKMLFLNFGILCLAPAAFTFLLPYYTGKIDLNYAVLVTALMIPRVPTNLIACSLGGEKAYKTGESLLSTPVHIRPVFLAKCAIPVFVSVIMIVISSFLTMASANVITRLIPNITPAGGYSAGQLVLLFPVSIMSSIIMMFISAVLTVNMKTPRQGHYANSAISFLFAAPAAAIVYLTHNSPAWSAAYFTVLLLCGLFFVKRISKSITRPQIMGKL